MPRLLLVHCREMSCVPLPSLALQPFRGIAVITPQAFLVSLAVSGT